MPTPKFELAIVSGPSRRALLSGVGASLTAVALTGCGETARPADAADLIFRGGPIVTVDDKVPTAEAVAVKGGKIVAVGTRAEIEALRGAATKVVELDGAALIPGFVDPHGHVSGVGLQAIAANLLPPPDGPGQDIAALQAELRRWLAANPSGALGRGWIVGFGYDDSQLKEQRHPDRDELDAVSTDLPILIIHQSGHLGVANSKALAAAGLSAASPDPEGGAIRRRAGGREPNGVLEETAFFPLLGAMSQAFTAEDSIAMLQAGAKLYASFGYTTAQDGRMTSAGAVALSRQAGAEGKLPIDIVGYPDILAVQDIAPSRTYVDHFRVGGAKLTIDGSPQGKTAWLTQPYFKPPAGRPADYRGYPAITPDQAMAAIDKAFAHDWQILVHANGDAAIDLLIACVRAATAKYGKADRRPVLIHGQTLRLDQIPALKDLGIIPSLFPMHTYYWGDFHRDSVLGPERAQRISPTGSVWRAGMRFTTHHDAPVALPDSIRVLSATAARKTRSGVVLGPDERVPVDVALKAMTLWAAYQHFEEASKGSIEVGKLADLVVLSDNPLWVGPDRLETLKVLKTFKAGVQVYARG